MRKINYKEKGITLLALVITIIILLILAGVTLSTTLGQNGLFQRAKQAEEKYRKAQNKEEKRIEEVEDEITQIQTGAMIEQVKDNNPGTLEEENEIKVINSIEDLVFFADDVRKGNTYENKTVKLGTNLDFELNKSYVNPNRTDYSKYGYEGRLKTALTTGEGFKTIGVNTNSSDRETKSFKGTFDGNGKVIRNLKIDNTLDNDTEDLRIGLFGNNYGTIKNIGIENCNIKGKIKNENGYSLMVGGITGFNYGNIELSYVSGFLTGESNCIYDKGMTIVGGISGQIGGGKIEKSLADCELYVNGRCAIAGGVCGRAGITGENGNRIFNCFSSPLMSISRFSSPDGYANVGGIIGSIDKNEICLIENSFVNTIIRGKTENSLGCSGGICGFWAGNGKINNCYVEDIAVDGTSSSGGILGGIYSQVSSEIFSCVDCKYYSVGIDVYCPMEGYDVNVKKVENKNDLPRIIDVVGEEFKKLPSGSIALKWQ